MTRYRPWCFTINNPTDDELTTLHGEAILKQCSHLVWQVEQGTSATPHVQGYIRWINGVSLATCRRRISVRGHFEKARGKPSTQLEYCTKDEGRISQGIVHGDFSVSQGSRTDLSDAIELGTCTAIAHKYPRVFVKYHRGLKALFWQLSLKEAQSTLRKDIHVTVLWGDTGFGKTRHVWEKEAATGLYILTSDDKKTWWNGYNGESAILIDDFTGSMNFSALLRLLDMYPVRLDIKHGHTYARFNRVYITSNREPCMWYPNIGERGQAALKRRIHKIIKMTAGLF